MRADSRGVIGWDVGGVQVKAAYVPPGRDPGSGPSEVVSEPFEIWRGPQRLPDVLRTVAERLQPEGDPGMALTMTAELSDAFQTKREGVRHVLDSFRAAFGTERAEVLSLEGSFTSLESARARPLDYAATNWVASVLQLAATEQAGILLDIGSTTTDILGFGEGRHRALGRTDVERLLSGELVYTGVIRTNPNTLAEFVPLRGGWCRTAAESFTCMGDAHLLLGTISEEDYRMPTPDGRGALSGAHGRIARLVCCDEETLSMSEARALAAHLAERQIGVIANSVERVLSSYGSSGPLGHEPPLYSAGSGAFLAAEVGRRVGLEVRPALEDWGEAARGALPAAAVASLWLARHGCDPRGG